uniref:Uncharacterized protein n=1 Tax=Faxonius propinquus nudivirus TaxID=3139431 RepID=A0AAU8GCU6_9VIRU
MASKRSFDDISNEEIRVMIDPETEQTIKKANLEFIKNEIQEKNFITASEFLNNTKLNLVQSNSNTISILLNISIDELIDFTSAENMTKILTKNCKTKDRFYEYNDNIYQFFYGLLFSIYRDKCDNDEILILIEKFLALLLVHKSNAHKYLNELKKMLDIQTQKNIPDKNVVSTKMKRLALMLLNPEDTTIEDVKDPIIEYVGCNHKKFFEKEIVPFLHLGAIFKQVIPPSLMTFKLLSTGSVKTKGDSIDTLKVIPTIPIIVPVTIKKHDTFNFLELYPNVSAQIISYIKQTIRFHDNTGTNISLNMFNSVNIGILKEQSIIYPNKTNNDDDDSTSMVFDIFTHNSLYQCNENTYIVIDNFNLIYDDINNDAVNKVKIKAYPKILISRTINSTNISMINFISDSKIAKLRHID